MLVIAAVVSFLATWLSEMQIIGLISAKKLVRTFYKFVESGSDLTDFDYSVDSAIFKLVTDDYFKKSRFQLFIHSFIVIAVITTGYFLGKSIFWGCIIGVIASTSLALSKELDLRYEFLADIQKQIERIENASNDNSAKNTKCRAESVACNNYCRKCGAPLSKDSAFCNKCGEKIISIEECENELP